MTQRERGFLLLCSHLGNPGRKVLTTAQLRVLAQRAAQLQPKDRDLRESDLIRLGYGPDMAARILNLLEDTPLLERYLRRGAKERCVPITRVTEGYPRLLRQRLGPDSPGCLWARGDLELLKKPALSLVGSRELGQTNLAFAEAVGRHAARLGMVLVSGNARGADRIAQDSCLDSGGQIISIVADALHHQREQKNILYLSEEDFDADFSSQRALSRNRCIHTLGQLVFVAQSEQGKGGTWSGTTRNLRQGWSPVICFRDGSDAVRELEEMGAYAIGLEELEDFQLPAGEWDRLF